MPCKSLASRFSVSKPLSSDGSALDISDLHHLTQGRECAFRAGFATRFPRSIEDIRDYFPRVHQVCFISIAQFSPKTLQMMAILVFSCPASSRSPHLPCFEFPNNSLSGTIPDSFWSALFWGVDLSFNRLSGNLSTISFSPANQNALINLKLNDNDFFGGLPNMSKMAALTSVSVSNTLVELCFSNPSFPPSFMWLYAANLPNGG